MTAAPVMNLKAHQTITKRDPEILQLERGFFGGSLSREKTEIVGFL
jgi:hypothetical protein